MVIKYTTPLLLLAHERNSNFNQNNIIPADQNNTATRCCSMALWGDTLKPPHKHTSSSKLISTYLVGLRYQRDDATDKEKKRVQRHGADM